MTANSNLILSSLDFDSLKENFKTFLKSQTIFKDVDYSGANINVLMDLLSYNSYLNSFYLNMVATESRLSSAQKRDSVVSHAKELNYLPISSKSAVANVSFTVSTVGIASPFTVPKGAIFSGQNSNGNYIFTTNQSYNFNSTNSTFIINNLSIYQGVYTTDTFLIDTTLDKQQFILSNPKIDTDSISVIVTENGANTTFKRADNLYSLNANSNVYFIQGAQNYQYEILFGDNLFGRSPINSSLVSVSYRITDGDLGNGVSSFNLYENLSVLNNGSASVSAISVNNPSTGGALPQDIESIRFYAPRYFATQQRASASDDYKSLILANFGGEISDVNVYGGELLTPKKYGYVAVCLKPAGGTITPNFIKSRITNFFSNTSVKPINIIITDPDYYYVSVSSNVEYQSTSTLLTSIDIETEILNNMLSYFSQNIESFNADFRYSKFTASIDESDSSILSNDTNINMIKRIYPISNVSSSYTIPFNNSVNQVNYQYNPYTAGSLAPDSVYPSLVSTPFVYVSNGVSYANSIIRDDNYGKITILNSVNGILSVVNNNVGSINYENGFVQLNNINISQFDGSYISLYLTLSSKDINITQNQILLIDSNDVNINVYDENEINT